MSDYFPKQFEVVLDVLKNSGNAVYGNSELGLILAQPSDDKDNPYQIDVEKLKNVLADVLSLSGEPLDLRFTLEFFEELLSRTEIAEDTMEDAVFEQIFEVLLRLLKRPLDKKLVGRLIVKILTEYDPRTEATLNGSTVEFVDAHANGYLDLDLPEDI